MYVSVINQHGREDKVNTDTINYTLSVPDTLFAHQSIRPRPLATIRTQMGKLVTHILSDPAFMDLRDGPVGYVLNLESLQYAYFNTKAGVIFLNFGVGIQVSIPISKQATLEQGFLSNPAFVDLRDGPTGYVLNLANFQRVDFSPEAKVAFIDFRPSRPGVEAQVSIPISKRATLEQALVTYSALPVPRFSARWKRTRFA